MIEVAKSNNLFDLPVSALIRVKERLPHGQFLPWIEAEFGMKERMARNFMRASEVYGPKTANFADLPVSALYELAAPSTPEVVRQTIEEMVVDGQKVTLETVRQTQADALKIEAEAKRRLADEATRRRSGGGGRARRCAEFQGSKRER